MIRRHPGSTLFPTRRSSDLRDRIAAVGVRDGGERGAGDGDVDARDRLARRGRGHLAGDLALLRRCASHTDQRDRKSTRLNSSHGYISYAVFCLKKKNTRNTTTRHRPPIIFFIFLVSHLTLARTSPSCPSSQSFTIKCEHDNIR